MAQTETFDPKRYTPFAPGVRVDQVLSTFPTIDTAVDHIKFTAGLEQIGRVIDRGTVHPRLHRRRPRLHPALAAPVPLAHRLHAAAADGDAAHRLGRSRGRSGRGTRTCRRSSPSARRSEGAGEIGTLKAFHTAGFLGSEHGPFLIVDPQDAASAVRPPKERDRRRASAAGASCIRRCSRRIRCIATPASSSANRWSRSLDAADRLLASPAAKAFDVSLEPAASRDAYGPSRFGRGCLLARRLIEGGARYVEVTSEYIPFVYWDTHEHGHERAKDDEGDDRRAGGGAGPRPRDARPARSHAGRAGQRVRPRRGHRGQGRQGSEGPGHRHARRDDRHPPLRHAPPLHRRRLAADVRRRREEGVRLRPHRRRAARARPSSTRSASRICTRRSSMRSASRPTPPTSPRSGRSTSRATAIGKPHLALFA